MNLSKMSPKDMLVWGLAIYGGYSLVKTQTKFLSAAGPSQQGGGMQGFKSRVGSMRCNGLKNRQQALTSRLSRLQNKPAGQRNPNWQAQLKSKLSLIESRMRQQGC